MLPPAERIDGGATVARRRRDERQMDFFGEPDGEPAPAPAPEPPASEAAASPQSGTRARRKRQARPDAAAAETAAEPVAAPAAAPEEAMEGEMLRRLPPPPSPVSFAAQATNPDLADFVAALGDEQLGYLAVAAARMLRQRLGGGSKRRRGAGPDALARAARLIAAELAAPGADGGDPE